MLKDLSEALHGAFHRPSTRAYRWVSGVVWTLILVSIAFVAAEFFLEGGLPVWVEVLDLWILGIFVVEIALRTASYRPPRLRFFHMSPAARLREHVMGRMRFLAQPLNLVDLLTVVALVPELRSLRGLRLLRALRLFGRSSPLEGIARAFSDNLMLFTFALSVLGVSVGVGGVTMFLVERDANPNVTHLADGLWWALVTVTTVGFGDIAPETGLGRIIAGVLMVVGMFTLALFAGIVGTTLLNTVLSVREESFRMMTTLDHIVVCGYDSGARGLLTSLEQELGDDTHREVVLFAPGERPPDTPPRFRWVSGDPTKESELEKVRLTHAHTAIIVGPRKVSPQQADAITILTAFTLRSYLGKQVLNEKRVRTLHVVAEILDEENVAHAVTAGADEVVESGRLGYSMMAHAAAQPGTAEILKRVAAPGSLNVYLGHVPEGLAMPMPYGQLVRRLKDERAALVIGLQDPETHQDRLNPPDHVVVEGDQVLIYLARKPVLGTRGFGEAP